MVHIFAREKINFKQCIYIIRGNPKCMAIGRRIHGARKCSIDLYNNDKLMCTLKETSVLGQIIESIPVIGLFYRNKFYLYRDNICCGSSRSEIRFGQCSLIFEFGVDSYHLVTHSFAKQSITKNGKQIAIYQRTNDGNYECHHTVETYMELDILLLFAALIETYMMLDTDWTSGYIPNDRYKNRASWLPPDEKSEEVL